MTEVEFASSFNYNYSNICDHTAKPHLSFRWGFLFMSQHYNDFGYSIVTVPRMSYARWGRQ